MNNAIDQIIQSEMDKLKEEDFQSERVTELVENQNEIMQRELEHRKKLLDVLSRVKRMGINIEFNEEMSTDDLEDLLKKIKV